MAGKYTLQRDLDSVGIGERWGCTFSGFINCAEHTTGERASPEELDGIIGGAFRFKLAAMANYIHHDDLEKDGSQCVTWDEEENPEWGYLVMARRALFTLVCAKMGVAVNHHNYEVAIMLTQYNTKHYCILTSSGELINPDPSLKGEIIETRPLLY